MYSSIHDHQPQVVWDFLLFDLYHLGFCCWLRGILVKRIGIYCQLLENILDSDGAAQAVQCPALKTSLWSMSSRSGFICYIPTTQIFIYWSNILKDRAVCSLLGDLSSNVLTWGLLTKSWHRWFGTGPKWSYFKVNKLKVTL